MQVRAIRPLAKCIAQDLKNEGWRFRAEKLFMYSTGNLLLIQP
jgi:hypothetical protein